MESLTWHFDVNENRIDDTTHAARELILEMAFGSLTGAVPGFDRDYQSLSRFTTKSWVLLRVGDHELTLLAGTWEFEGIGLFGRKGFKLRFQPESETRIAHTSLQKIEIFGAGTVEEDWGLGGIGIAGIAKAEVINYLTTHETTESFIALEWDDGRCLLCSQDDTPSRLDVMELEQFLTPTIVAMRKAGLSTDATPRASAVEVSAALSRFAKLLDDGLLTREEFELQKTRLLGG